MSGRIVPTILGMGQRFTGIGPLPIFLVFDGRPWNCYAPVDVSQLGDMLQWAYTEAQSLVEDDLSAILDPFGSNQFMLCPQFMLFFQRLCPGPFPPVSLLVDYSYTYGSVRS